MPSDNPPFRPVSAVRCYLAYGTALVAGYFVWRFVVPPAFLAGPAGRGLTVTLLATVIVWIFSIASGNSSIYDPYWVIAPPLLALGMIAAGNGGLGGSWSARQVVVFICFFLWATRYHLFYRWTGWRSGLVHEDWRYEEMRRLPIPYWINSLTGMHLFPTLLVYAAFVPAALVLSRPPANQPPLGPWDILGVVGALSAVAIEFISDRQLHQFRTTPDYAEGKTFRGGLWNLSRHPNYFGESLFWISMIPFAVAAGVIADHPLFVIGGPILMALFFRFSAHLMDVRSLRLRNDYGEAMGQLNAMVPLPPKKS